MIIEDLEPDELCRQHGDQTLMGSLMSDWQKTSSPLAYWIKQISGANYKERRESMGVYNDVITSYGLPVDEMASVCREQEILENRGLRMRASANARYRFCNLLFLVFWL